MLVLTRKAEEKIVIGKDKTIVITILKIQGDKVSIGIEADKDTPIYRKELLMRDLEKNTLSTRDLAKELEELETVSAETYKD